jgi:cytochrome b involved in lipid metabolism
VYNVKEYMPDHPGGGELIEEHLGKNIEEPFEEAEHTKHAKKLMMAQPIIGKITKGSS